MGVKPRRPVVTVQFPDGSAKRLKDHFHRVEADSSRADDLHAALDAILADPKGTLRGAVQKSTFKGHKPAMKKDEESGIKEAVSAMVDAALA